jgi:DNA-binding MarR family transcriptional regulator
MKNTNSGISKVESDADYRLLSRLRQATDAVYNIRQKELKQFNITPEQVGAMHLIHTFGNQANAFELSKVLNRKPSTMTVLLRRMEREGLIKKTVDKRKKNMIRLSLTRKGAVCYEKGLELSMVGEVFRRLSSEQKNQLSSLLEQLRDAALENQNIDVNSYSQLLEKLDMLK